VKSFRALVVGQRLIESSAIQIEYRPIDVERDLTESLMEIIRTGCLWQVAKEELSVGTHLIGERTIVVHRKSGNRVVPRRFQGRTVGARGRPPGPHPVTRPQSRDFAPRAVM